MTPTKNREFLCFRIIWVAALFTSCAARITDGDFQTTILGLWDADTNRASSTQIGWDYRNKYGKTLFPKVDPNLLQQPTYKALMELFEAYDSPTVRLSASHPKVKSFMDKVSNTGPYKVLGRYLAGAGYKPAKSPDSFRKHLTDLWFGDYSRGTAGMSSGFRHVFIGEARNGQVLGLHNWLRMYYLEKQGKLQLNRFLTKEPHVAVTRYHVGEAFKPVGSVLIGTSPEFDLAVLTLCFVARRGENACRFFLKDCSPIEVSSFPFNTRDEVLIGTAFPSPWETDAECPIR